MSTEGTSLASGGIWGHAPHGYCFEILLPKVILKNQYGSAPYISSVAEHE